jgi:hypothetical protein
MSERDRSPSREPKPIDTGLSEPVIVWEVFEGEDYEGGHAWGVFTNRDAAVHCAKERTKEGGVPEKWTETEPNDTWKRGSSYIEIIAHQVWPSYDEFRADIDREIAKNKARYSKQEL